MPRTNMRLWKGTGNWSVPVTAAASLSLPQLAVYVMHHPRLVKRRRDMSSRLEQVSARDVTWVLCANKEDIERLSAPVSACLFQGPGVQASNGSRSIALKHLIAYEDMRRRNLSEALMLEDDAAIPPDLWHRLSARWASRPDDADIFWLGGGFQGKDLQKHPLVDASFCDSQFAIRGRSLRIELECVRRRNMKDHIPRFITSAAYVMTRRGAASMQGWPVRGPSDKVISDVNYLCRPSVHSSVRNQSECHLLSQYGPHRWFVGTQSNETKTHIL